MSKQLLYSIPDAAELLNISPKTLWDWVYSRKIATVLVGRLRKIRSTEIERFIEVNTVPAKAS